MEFSFTVGHQDKHLVRFSFGHFLLSMKIIVDDKVIMERVGQLGGYKLKSEELILPINKNKLSAHFSEKWEFEISDDPIIKIRIERQRPKWYSILTPSYFRVSVDGKDFINVTGF